jgi:hypothetical protein
VKEGLEMESDKWESTKTYKELEQEGWVFLEPVGRFETVWIVMIRGKGKLRERPFMN